MGKRKRKSSIPARDEQLRDFRNFMFVVWKHLGLPEPTDVQYDIAHRLQHGPDRDIIEAQRGQGKSWVTVAYAAWCLYWWPDIRILIISASATKAGENATFLKYLIDDIPWLQWLAPSDEQRDAKVAFDVGPAGPSQAPSVKSAGLFGQITGSRANLIIPDDIETPDNSETQLMRDKVEQKITEFDAILAKKPAEASTMPWGVKFLGTPQTEQTVYRKLLKKGYSCCIWPSRYPTPDELRLYGEYIAPMIRSKLEANPRLGEPLRGVEGNMGEPTDPRMFGEEDLQERELSFGRSGYAMQYQLNPSISDANRYPLKLRDLIVMAVNSEVGPENPVWMPDSKRLIKTDYNVGLEGDYFYEPAAIQGEHIPYTGSILWIDPSGRGKDLTAYVVLKMLNGFLHIPAGGWSGFLGGYEPKTLQGLADLAKKHDVNVVGYENNFGDGMFGELLKPYLTRTHPVKVEEIRSTAMKEARILDTLEPVLNQHRLVVDPSLIEEDYHLPMGKDIPLEHQAYYRGFFQLTRIERVRNALRHDDLVDVLAQGVAYWVEQMGQDAERKMESRKDDMFKKQLEDWLEPPDRRNNKSRRGTGDSKGWISSF